MSRILLLGLMLGIFGCEKKPAPIEGKVAEAIEARADAGRGDTKTDSTAESFDHTTFDQLLRAHVREGRVDYAQLAQPEARKKLDAYTTSIAAAKMDALSRDDQKALLINAYNAYTIVLMLEHYPTIESIKDLDEPWKQTRWNVAGDTLSLDDIEHGLLRPLFKDPRIHFAVNCASIGCPPLRASAFDGPNLETQLEDTTRAIMADEQYVSVRDGALHLTRILKWYGSDFTARDYAPRADSLAAFVAVYAPEATRKAIAAKPDISVQFRDYDWKLNDTAESPANRVD